MAPCHGCLFMSTRSWVPLACCQLNCWASAGAASASTTARESRDSNDRFLMMRMKHLCLSSLGDESAYRVCL